MMLVGLGFAGLLTLHKALVGVHFCAGFERLLLLLAGAVALWHVGVARL